MRDFREWISAVSLTGKPWLLAGKAIQDATANRARGEGFEVFALPDAAGQIDATVAFVPDIEHVQDRAEGIAARSRYLAMPREPHVGGWATGRPLESFVAEIPVLRQLEKEGHLLSVPLWTALNGHADDVIEGDFTGEEVPLRLLAMAGVKMARHSGARLPKAPNGGFEATHSVMDRRSGGLAAVRRHYGISYGPYGYPVPARVFVGSDDEQLMGVRVLHYSIEKYSSMDVTVEVLDHRSMPVPKDPKNRSRTGFSFCRFDIPRLCNFAGRGVYVDADMQVFTDITDLWTLPLDDVDIIYALTHPRQGRNPQTSVMLLNCAVLNWDVHDIVRGLDDGKYTYKQLMTEMCILPKERHRPDLPYWWNSLETYEPGRTSLIHYTDMPFQPWISHDNPNGHLWYACCAEALDSGFIDADEVRDAARRGHISPMIFSWIGRDSSETLERQAAIWVAPYHRYTRVATDLEGSVSLGKDKRLRGWAWRPASPEEPVDLGVFRDDLLLLEFTADQYGEFLERHGKGNGRHAFDVELPESILLSNTGEFSVRSVSDGVSLAGSPVSIIQS